MLTTHHHCKAALKQTNLYGNKRYINKGDLTIIYSFI